MEPSVFTRIIRGEIPAATVYEDEHTIAFMDAGQVNPGHVIVASKRQVETVVDIDDELAAHFAREPRPRTPDPGPENATISNVRKPLYPHRRDRNAQAAEGARVRGVHQDSCAVGAPAHLPDVRVDAVLRFVAEPAREQARPCQPASGRGLGGAGRALALLLSG